MDDRAARDDTFIVGMNFSWRVTFDVKFLIQRSMHLIVNSNIKV